MSNKEIILESQVFELEEENDALKKIVESNEKELARLNETIDLLRIELSEGD